MNQKRGIKEHVTHEDAKYYHFEAKVDHEGKAHSPRMTLPHGILPNIKSPEDIQALLDHFGDNVRWLSLTPDNLPAHRFYVERVRPTMRFYCEKYSVDVPEWLRDDNYFLNMSSAAKVKLFGPEPLKPIKYSKLSIRDKSEAEV